MMHILSILFFAYSHLFGMTQVYGLNSGTNTNQYTTEYGVFDDDAYYGSSTTFSTTDGIANTTYDDIYKTSRNAATNPGKLTYTIPVQSGGNYMIELHFAELFYTANGSRIFDVVIDGELKIDNLDIHALVGADAALRYRFNVKATSTNLIIDFDSSSGTGGVGRPTINAIGIFQRKQAIIN